jgi:flagellar hook-length control protein FliK
MTMGAPPSEAPGSSTGSAGASPAESAFLEILAQLTGAALSGETGLLNPDPEATDTAPPEVDDTEGVDATEADTAAGTGTLDWSLVLSKLAAPVESAKDSAKAPVVANAEAANPPAQAGSTSVVGDPVEALSGTLTPAATDPKGPPAATGLAQPGLAGTATPAPQAESPVETGPASGGAGQPVAPTPATAAESVRVTAQPAADAAVALATPRGTAQAAAAAQPPALRPVPKVSQAVADPADPVPGSAETAADLPRSAEAPETVPQNPAPTLPEGAAMEHVEAATARKTPEPIAIAATPVKVPAEGPPSTAPTTHGHPVTGVDSAPRSEPAPAPPPASGAAETAPRPAQIGDQAVRSVRLLTDHDGHQSVTVRLVPETLGELRLEVERAGDTLTVRMASASPAVREALESQSRQIQQALLRDGIETVRVEVNVATAGSDTPQGRGGSEAAPYRSAAQARGTAHAPGDLPAGSAPERARTARHAGQLNLFV